MAYGMPRGVFHGNLRGYDIYVMINVFARVWVARLMRTYQFRDFVKSDQRRQLSHLSLPIFPPICPLSYTCYPEITEKAARS
jgi:hypothetical protein